MMKHLNLVDARPVEFVWLVPISLLLVLCVIQNVSRVPNTKRAVGWTKALSVQHLSQQRAPSDQSLRDTASRERKATATHDADQVNSLVVVLSGRALERVCVRVLGMHAIVNFHAMSVLSAAPHRRVLGGR